MAGVARRLLVLSRGLGRCGRRYSDVAPSQGLSYTTDLAAATVSLSSARPLPAYRVMNAAGHVLDTQQDPNVGLALPLRRALHNVSPLIVIRQDNGEDVREDGAVVSDGPAALQGTENGEC